MSDVVSGLLSKLDELEQMTLAAKPHRQQLLWSRRAGDEKTNAYLTQVADPDDVLRLCRAHRDLIELHGHEPRYGYQPDCDDTPGAYGRIEQACTECGSADAAVRWPCPSLRLVARGLGVEDKEN